MEKIKNIACILFDEMTSLDWLGFFDPLKRLSKFDDFNNVKITNIGMQKKVQDGYGLEIGSLETPKELQAFDMIFIPGGFGTRELQHNKNFIDWIKTASPNAFLVSVCTGSLIFGAAGFLEGKRATTHPNAYQDLELYCKEVIKERIVDADNIITAGGVSSSIDLGLYVIEKLADKNIAKQIAKQMDYVYY